MAYNQFKVLKSLFKDKYATKFDPKQAKPQMCNSCGKPLQEGVPHIHESKLQKVKGN